MMHLIIAENVVLKLDWFVSDTNGFVKLDSKMLGTRFGNKRLFVRTKTINTTTLKILFKQVMVSISIENGRKMVAFYLFSDF